MTWTRVQKSAAYANSGTGTLPSGVTQGSLVVAFLHSTSNTAFTGPPGWSQGPAGGIVGSRTEIWYLPPQSNPGGFSSAAFTVLGTMRCALAEYHTDVPGAGAVLDSSGMATNPAGTSDPVTAASANLAGDLAVCAFFEHFSAATAVTWTDPAGFTALNEQAASSANQAYCADELSAAAGTLAATGATASSGAWSGALATFAAVPLATPAPLVVPPAAVLRATDW